MTVEPSKTESPAGWSASTAVAEALASHAGFVALADEIRAANPLGDLEGLSALRVRLLDVLDDQPESPAARGLLDLVSMQQSRVARAVDGLWQDEKHAFTPALIRSLGSLGPYGRAASELEERLDAAPLQERAGQRPVEPSSAQSSLDFLSGPLVDAGLVERLVLAADPAPSTLLRLTSVGNRILPVLAARVLDAELGRFAWPKDVPPLRERARNENLDLFPFKRAGSDGEAVEDCLGARRGYIGALSVPLLLGVARTVDAPGRPAAEGAVRSFALCNPPEQMERADARKWMGRIADNQRTLIDRAEGMNRQWILEVLTSPRVKSELGRDLREVCEQTGVVCDLVA